MMPGLGVGVASIVAAGVDVHQDLVQAAHGVQQLVAHALGDGVTDGHRQVAVHGDEQRRLQPMADPSDADAGDVRTRAIIDAVQREGTAWLGGTIWGGLAAMRISVSGWQTTTDDIDRTASVILEAAGRI